MSNGTARLTLRGVLNSIGLLPDEENSMLNDNVGVWIDHRKAVIVVVTPTEEHTVHIVSKVEKHLERSGDSPLRGSFEAAQVPPDNSRQRAFTGSLNIYYDAVIAAIRNADSLIILGPGEAKGELRRRLVKNKLGARIGAVETMAKASDRQIAARVREYFSGAWSPKGAQGRSPKRRTPSPSCYRHSALEISRRRCSSQSKHYFRDRRSTHSFRTAFRASPREQSLKAGDKAIIAENGAPTASLRCLRRRVMNVRLKIGSGPPRCLVHPSPTPTCGALNV